MCEARLRLSASPVQYFFPHTLSQADQDLEKGISGVSSMIYADDIQLYVTMTEQQRPDVIQRLESCLSHIQSWSTANKLKLNSDKTEVIHITSQFKQHTPIEILRISDCCIRPVTCARDLGTIITSNL